MAESSTPSANESVEEKLLEAQNTIQVLKNELKSTRRKLEAAEVAKQHVEHYVESLRTEVRALGEQLQKAKGESSLKREIHIQDDSEKEDGEIASDSPTPVELTEALLEENTTDALKAAAEAAIEKTGFTYDDSSGWYYDSTTNLYYDPASHLYYKSDTGTYYSYDLETQSYQVHSQVPPDAWIPCIRAIVTESESVNIGTLAMITVDGGTIGRDKTRSHCLHVPEKTISKSHIEITFDSETNTYSVKDLGSQNGTFLNNVRLSEAKCESALHLLSHGDILAIGSTSLVLHIHPGSETCDGCEPGEVQLLLRNAMDADQTNSIMDVEDKELRRRRELNILKKRYLLRRRDTESVESHSYLADDQYEDRAAKRRIEVGSDVPITEKNERPASVHRPIAVSNKGRQMLEKMGWAEGQGLGANNMGISEPVQAVVRSQRSGLGMGVARSIDSDNSRSERSREIWDKARERFASTT